MVQKANSISDTVVSGNTRDVASSIDSLNSEDVQSFAGSVDNASIGTDNPKSITSTLSRVETAMSEVLKVRSLRQTVTNARDDNEITARNEEHARKSTLGRILTHPDISDAMRVATHTGGSIAEKLADVRPEDERAVREITSKAEEASETEQGLVEKGEEEEKKYPPVDRGYAWVICATELLMIITTWGATTAFGIFIAFWLNDGTFDGADPMNYALSSSIAIFLAQALAPVAMITQSMIGLKVTIALGTAVNFAGYLLCSFCTKLWQLYCTQGVLVGVGFAFIFNPSIVILSSWFVKYRAISSGVTICGAGIGGVAFALGSQALINLKHDYRWAMRMIAIVTLGLNCFVVCFLKERVPPKRERTKKYFKLQVRTILNYRTMLHWQIIAITFWFAMAIVSYIVITFSLASFATFIGLSETQGSYVTGIFNGCQAIGRPLLGICGDRFGRINTALAGNVIVIILIFAFFVNCNNSATLISFSIVSGLVTGWSQLLNQAIMPDAVPMAEYPSVWSYENIIVGCFCLFSEVVALKLRDLSSSMPFLKAQLFAGFMVVGSLICLIPVREWKIRQMIESRLEDAKDELETIQSSADPEKNREDFDLLAARIQRYQGFLTKSAHGYLHRLFYPVKA